MKFGEVALDNAAGTILAHSVRLSDGVLRKGRHLDADDITRMRDSGLSTVTVAELEDGDLDENAAALRLAEALHIPGLSASGGRTGRANLRAESAGVALIDAETIHRMNAVDEALTISTVRPFDAVSAGQVTATVKLITFGLPAATVDTCAAIAQADGPPVRIAPYDTSLKIGLVQTVLPGLKDSIIAKATATTGSRLAEMGLAINHERHCAHAVSAVTDALAEMSATGCDIVLVLGASAIVDRRDIVPTAVSAAGGEIEHLGLPVDPGNLMLFARLGEMRVLGIPGSARSPRLHGFDWVLQRLVAGLTVTREDLTRMGVGGLLKEMPGRPMSREDEDMPDDIPEDAKPIGALLLAAGQSRRMGKANKMLVEIDGTPMVVHAARALIASGAAPIVVVLGHEPAAVEAALQGLPVTFVRNPDYADGLSTSLKAGLAALPDHCSGAVIALGDMPGVTAADIDSLIDAFDPVAGHTICVPTHHSKRGNPVLWGRRYFAEMAGVSGDVGARHLIGENADQVVEVPRDNPGVLIDLDTPEAVAAHLRG
jgi:molybdenum cofactor cytidylyltransferase